MMAAKILRFPTTSTAPIFSEAIRGHDPMINFNRSFDTMLIHTNVAARLNYLSANTPYGSVAL